MVKAKRRVDASPVPGRLALEADIGLADAEPRRGGRRPKLPMPYTGLSG